MARERNTQPPRQSTPVQLTINIVDANDNAPAFAMPVYTASVAAVGPARRPVINVAATDVDRGINGRLAYVVAAVNNGGEQNFEYDGRDGVLYANGQLQPGQQYQVLLDAIDGGGRSGRTNILVTAAGDQQVSPTAFVQPSSASQQSLQQAGPTQIPEFTAVVSEDTLPNSIVVSLSGAFEPGAVRYDILSGNEEQRFALDPQTGILSTQRPFDREQTSAYRLVIEARPTTNDPSGSVVRTALAVTVEDANDNAPRFLGPQPIGFEVRAGAANEVVGRLVVCFVNALRTNTAHFSWRTSTPARTAV